MAKKNGVPNGDVTAVVQNGQQTVVVHTKAMGMPEKARIEKLIDNRADALRQYLGEMEAFALEANENTTLMDQEALAVLRKEMAVLAVERERLTGQKQGEVAAAEGVLEREHEEKLSRLKAAEGKLKVKHKELLTAVKAEADRKYQKKEDLLVGKEIELKGKLAEMERAEKSSKLVRKVALSNSLRALKDDVGDYRNKAVEILHTEVVENGGAKQCLAMIPDATEFRKQVTPAKLFAVFNDGVKVHAIGHVEVKCGKCGSMENLHEHVNGSMYCRKCGKYDVLPDSVKKMVVLPSLRDIAEASKTKSDHPDEPSGRPVVEVEPQPAEATYAALNALGRCLDVRDAVESGDAERLADVLTGAI